MHENNEVYKWEERRGVPIQEHGNYNEGKSLSISVITPTGNQPFDSTKECSFFFDKDQAESSFECTIPID